MKIPFRFVLAFVLVGLLLTGLRVSSFGNNGPALPPDARDTANQSALSLTLYLTDALHLSQTQSWAVRACTQRELQQLAATPAAADTAEVALRAQEVYEAAMARILTPEQYRAFEQLERGQLVSSIVARVLAAR
ncbi:hypothetical protein GCM10027048_41510 [Hymenobacter coalescens]